MDEQRNERIIKRQRIYLILAYLMMVFGTYIMYMHEYLIMVHMKQPIHHWFRDVWFGIGLKPKLFMVITGYVTLHLLVVGVVRLGKRLASGAW